MIFEQYYVATQKTIGIATAKLRKLRRPSVKNRYLICQRFYCNKLCYSLYDDCVYYVDNTKNCSLSIVLTAPDQKPQKSLKR